MRKNLFFAVICCCFFAVIGGNGYAGEIAKNIYVSLSGTTPHTMSPHKSSVSMCQVIDLGKMGDIDGNFSFQFLDIDQNTSGTTINAYSLSSNISSVTAWEGAEKTTILTEMDTTTGNSKYVYEFSPPLARYIRIGFTVGDTSVTPYGVIHIR